jgi:NAD(P)-dependent dehydrogenase (short-subunit alcohol dehydrogenase family)
MGRIFITGAADGLGQLAARSLVEQGHQVVLHARNPDRAAEALSAVPGAEAALSADLSSIRETMALADQVNALGEFTAIIHNAGIGYQEQRRVNTEDGLPHVFAVNSLAPYILTSLIHKPQRLIYLSSGLHQDGASDLNDMTWQARSWNGFQAYAESKFHDALLASAIARKWSDVYANAMEPGWVATKMGGKSAPDSLEEGYKTQVWLAVSDDPAVLVSGAYFYHRKLRPAHPKTLNIELQERFLEECGRLSGVFFPTANI